MLSLSSCIAVGQLDRRAVTFTDQVAIIQNQSVLKNLARASRNEPLYFLALNQLSATGTTDFHFTPPQYFLGPLAILNKNPVDRLATFDTNGSTFLDNATNSSFQMSLLGAKDFYNGLMGPITLQDVDLLLHQGYSRELIFYLAIDKATVSFTDDGSDPATETDPTKVHTLVVYNTPSANPDDRLTHGNLDRAPGLTDLHSYWLFQYLIMQAMKHGLTTETYQTPDTSAGTLGDELVTRLLGSSAAAPGASPKPKMKVAAALCYDRALAKDAAALSEIDPKSFCGGTHKDDKGATGAATPLAVTLHDPGFLQGKKLDIEVSTRSIYQIFYALGGMVRTGANITLLDFGLPSEKEEEQPLIGIQVAGESPIGRDGCFSRLNFEGRSYCVPQDADNTKRIFGILNALLALKQSVSDQPVTQTVRITQ